MVLVPLLMLMLLLLPQPLPPLRFLLQRGTSPRTPTLSFHCCGMAP